MKFEKLVKSVLDEDTKVLANLIPPEQRRTEDAKGIISEQNADYDIEQKSLGFLKDLVEKTIPLKLFPVFDGYPLIGKKSERARSLLLKSNSALARMNIDIVFRLIEELCKKSEWEEAGNYFLPVTRVLFGIHFGQGKQPSTMPSCATKERYLNLLEAFATRSQSPIQYAMHAARANVIEGKYKQADKMIKALQQTNKRELKMKMVSPLYNPNLAVKAFVPLMRGQIATMRGDLKEAENLFLQSLEWYKKSHTTTAAWSGVHEKLAHLYEKMGRHQEAKDNFLDTSKYATDPEWQIRHRANADSIVMRNDNKEEQIEQETTHWLANADRNLEELSNTKE
eukprot:CAMPEP_0170193400 /NCGR_PEP_ID=MMETSP0040_2-20121228/56791_1 /TAXON_ID=641309 /ORGANISM="Lotharella oceanica, Strain CCMP622" /LENGTH=338 /DNA_ID=CAMNT_0010442015 /DNA_START=197 /DNA_END=1213 /DNA_ORIENTATION=-